MKNHTPKMMKKERGMERRGEKREGGKDES